MNVLRKHSGFTLIEMLVVIVITGIVITMAVLAFGSMNKGRETKMTAEQLSRAMHAAKMQAILMPQTLGLRLTRAGYRFYVYTKGSKGKYAWKKLKDDNLSQTDAFAKGIRYKLSGLTKVKGKSLGEKKMILFSQSGDVTPFKLILCDQGQTVCFKLWLDKNGVFNLKSFAGES